MKQTASIRYKAAFLLVVFALNTIVGFACAMGADMDFNKARGKENVIKPAVHVHADGKKHHHKKKHLHSTHVHSGGKKHEHHSKPVEPQVAKKSVPAKQEDGCCNEKVLKFQSLDKAINQHSTALTAPVFIAIIHFFAGIEIPGVPSQYPPKYKARLFYPPPPDIRIAIQRFQI